MTTKEKKSVEKLSFYQGRAILEKKPWGDHFRITIDGRSGILSNTRITKFLDKSQALIPWAVGLVGSHVTSTFEDRKGSTFTKEEINLVVAEAIRKPEEAKVSGGNIGTYIHDYSHEFAKADIAGTKLPNIPKMPELGKEDREKVLNGINGFLDWYNSNDVKFLEMEKIVYYNSLLAGDTKEGEDTIEYFGILDLLAKVNGKIMLIDYKTGKRLYSEQRYQLSGYTRAWNSNVDNKKQYAQASGVLIFNKESGGFNYYEIPLNETEEDFKAFKGLYSVAQRETVLEKQR
jgi:hypothetical protein